MADPGGRTVPYGERQATAWLTWLARGMLRHGQTVFLIEKLQPSWLESRGALLIYLMISRTLLCVLPFVVIGLVAEDLTWTRVGLAAGLGVGLLETLRFSGGRAWARLRDADRRNRWLILSLLYGLIGGISVYLWSPESSELIAPSIGAYFGLVIGFRGFWSGPESDIQTVDVLIWSWRGALRGAGKLAAGWTALFTLTESEDPLRLLIATTTLLLLLGWTWKGTLEGPFKAVAAIIFSALVGLTVEILIDLGDGGFFGEIVRSIFVLSLCAVAFLGLFFGGLKAGVKEMTLAPNQGIRLSARNAMYGALAGFAVAWIAAPVTFLALASFDDPEWDSDALIFFTVGGGIVALAAALWFGGLDVFQHYLLRFLLWCQGRLSWRCDRFLDYAATELGFLQKVGGGYMFIHRYLLEHFAAMEVEAGEDCDEGERWRGGNASPP